MYKNQEKGVQKIVFNCSRNLVGYVFAMSQTFYGLSLLFRGIGIGCMVVANAYPLILSDPVRVENLYDKRHFTFKFRP